MALTRNLKLRLSPDLTASARYNLERIDQLGSVFPIGSSATQTINSSSDIRLNANATSLGGDGNGTVFAPNLQLSANLLLESGPYELTISAPVLSTDLTLLLPSTAGNSGQFLRTDGTGTLDWGDPPTSNLSTLNDTSISSPAANEILQYNGTSWVNASIPVTKQSGTFEWNPGDGSTRTITHNYGSTSIAVWIYDTDSKTQVLIEDIDYSDSNTILLTAHRAPDSTYIVHLIQTN